MYGGCGGSENLFLTLSECRGSCEAGGGGGGLARTSLSADIFFPAPETEEHICSLPPLLPGQIQTTNYAWLD